MLRIASAAFAVLFLTACQPDQLASVCRGVESLHSSFTILAASGEFSERTARAELAAYASAKPICDNPQAFTYNDALIAAVNAYVIIKSAMAESDRANVVLYPQVRNLERALDAARQPE